MSFPICGLKSSVRFALVALDSTSDVLNTADSNLKAKEVGFRNSHNAKNIRVKIHSYSCARTQVEGVSYLPVTLKTSTPSFFCFVFTNLIH